MNRTKALAAGGGLGLAVGILLFVLGASPIRLSARSLPAGPAGPARTPGAAEAEQLMAAQSAKVDKLRERLRTAEEECADLRKRAAAAPPAPVEESRADKARRMGKILARAMKMGSREPSQENKEAMLEAQKAVGEMLQLAKELGISMTDPGGFYMNPEFVSGLYEGVLEGCGIAADPAALEAWRARVAERLAPFQDRSYTLKAQVAGLELTGDFLDQFGQKLFDKDPSAVSQLSAFGSTSSQGSSQATTARAAELLARDVAKFAKLDDVTAAALRPTAEAWARDYAALLADARQRNGGKSVDLLFGTDPKSLVETRDSMRLKARIVDLEARAVETFAGLVPSESAEKVRKFQKTYFFQELTAP